MIPNLSAIVTAALEAEARTGLPAELSIAQCGLETGWLKYAPGNNAFGVKWSGKGPRQKLVTTEWFTDAELARFRLGRPADDVIRATGRAKGAKREYVVRDWFASYDTLADSFTEHARLISDGAPYRKAWARFQAGGALEQLIRDIAPVYATAPNYADVVLQIIRQRNIQTALATHRRGLQEAIAKNPQRGPEPPSAG